MVPPAQRRALLFSFVLPEASGWPISFAINLKIHAI